MTTRLLLAVVAGCALAGCSSAPPPRFGEARVSTRERTERGVVLDFVIPADNPGPVALPLREVEYALQIDGREVFRGVRSPEATLRRFGTQEIHLPGVIPAGAAPAGAASYRLSGTVRYIQPGVLAETLFDAELIRPTAAFDLRGEVDLGAVQALPRP